MSNKAFTYWWYNIGSGMTPRKDEDQEQHAGRVAEAAWDAAIENSAAPDLLEALKTMHSLMSGGCGELARLPFAWREVFNEAEAAIAKAEGRDA